MIDPAGTIVQIEPTSLRGSPLSPDELVRADRGPVFFTIGNEEDKLRVLASPVVRTNGTWVVAVGGTPTSCPMPPTGLSGTFCSPFRC